jgi:beta-glucosidase
VPAHTSKWLLETVLRGEWNFKGFLVSDYDAINQLQGRHAIAADKAQAARFALEAGVDVELPDPDCYQTLIAEVKAGRISEVLIDKSGRTHLAREIPTRTFRESLC